MSSINPPTIAMDVDSPSNGPGTLKRCSSAPMINDSVTIMATANPSTSSARDQQCFNIFGTSLPATRPRRFSASSSSVPGSPVSIRLTPRINQLRQEEHADVSNSRELAHEREIHNTMQMSQSWEDLRLMNESHNDNRGNNKMGPLHVTLPSYNILNYNSPTNSSPTRLSSPGFQSPTRTSRTFIRRSASPVLRPSPLGVKRKLDDDASPRAKRVYSYSVSERGGLLTTTSNSLPGSLSSVGTPESLSSADSPSFNFRNVDSPSPSRAMPSEPMIVAKSSDDDMAESPS